MNFVDRVVRFWEPLKGSQKWRKASVISLVAALMEGKCWIDRGKRKRLIACMYTLFVGPPGSGKSDTLSALEDLVMKFQTVPQPSGRTIQIGPNITTPAKFIEIFSKSGKSGGVTPEGELIFQSAIYFMGSELSSLTEDIGGGSLAHDLLELYDFKSKHTKETKANKEETITFGCCNIIAATTPRYIAKYLPSESSGNGLMARMLVVNEDDDQPKSKGTKVPLDPDEEQKIIDEMHRIFNTKGEFSIEPDAEEFYQKWCDATTERMRELAGSEDCLVYYYARKPIHLLKLCLVFSVSDNSYRRITIKHLKEAITWLEEIEVGMFNGMPIEEAKNNNTRMQRLMSFISKTVWHTKEEIMTTAYERRINFVDETTDKLLEQMVNCGYIVTRNRYGTNVPEYLRKTGVR
jgi:hypothetical protein